MVSSDDKDERCAGGEVSWSDTSSVSSVTSSCVSEGAGIVGNGDCAALKLGGLGDLQCWALYIANGSQ